MNEDDIMGMIVGADRYATSFCGAQTCTTGTTQPTTSIDTIRKATTAMEVLLRMESARIAVEAASREHFFDAMLYGMSLQVQRSPLSTTTAPIRQHKHRRNQTEAYHARIQKKWTKRFGTGQVPCAYVIDNNAFRINKFNYGKTLIVHPSHYERLAKI